MSMKQDEKLIVSYPAKDIPTPVKGSIIAQCCDCGIDVLVSPATLIYAGPNVKSICVSCLQKRKPGRKDTVMPLSDGQIREAKKFMGEES